jgi:sigma-B regulation protein RsbU (phosphoserine phosphatase)
LFDGVIMASGYIASFIGPERFRELYTPFLSKPLVSISRLIPGIPSFLPENTLGMSAVVRHLIQDHGARRIAFMKGPSGNVDADERFEAYRGVLVENGVPIEPDLVVQGNFRYSSGTDAMRRLMDAVGDRSDAVAASNDEMARAAYDALIGIGRAVPQACLVAGFDDVPFARYMPIPLTTAHQPFREIVTAAVNALSRLMKNEKVDGRIVLASRIARRKSCGYVEEPEARPMPQGAASAEILNSEQITQIKIYGILRELQGVTSAIASTFDPAHLFRTLAANLKDFGIPHSGCRFIRFLKKSLLSTST